MTIKLESLRNKQIAEVFYVIGDSDPVNFQHLRFIGYINRKIIDFLRQLENPKDDTLFFNNNSYLKIIVLMFVELESFIGDIGKIFCKLNGFSYRLFKKLPLEARLKKIMEFAQISKKQQSDFYKHGIFQELQAFEQLRNTIFHGGYYKELNFNEKKKKASLKECVKEKIVHFSTVPHYGNFIDVMQAFKITVCIFDCFRFIFSPYDIMPNSFIMFKDKASFMKISIIYSDFIVPYFNKILNKHNMTTDLKMQYKEFHFSSAIDLKQSIRVIINTGQYAPHFSYNSAITNYWIEMLDYLTRDVPADSTKFRLANYIRH